MLFRSEDLPRLEGELADKPAEEQWRILLEVRTFLLEGDQEEQQAFNEWNPSAADLEAEWRQMMSTVTLIRPEERRVGQECRTRGHPES